MHQISAVLMAGDAQKGLLADKDPQNLQRWWQALGPLFDEVILVAPDPVAYLGWDGLIISGHYRQTAPLCAVRAALQVAQHEQILAIDPAESMLSTQIIAKLTTGAELRWDVIALQAEAQASILPVVFHKRCLKILDRHLAQPAYRMDAFFQQVRLHIIAFNHIAI